MKPGYRKWQIISVNFKKNLITILFAVNNICTNCIDLIPQILTALLTIHINFKRFKVTLF